MIVDLPAKFGSSGIIRFEISRQKAKWGLKTSDPPAHPQKPKIAKTRKWFFHYTSKKISSKFRSCTLSFHRVTTVKLQNYRSPYKNRIFLNFPPLKLKYRKSQKMVFRYQSYYPTYQISYLYDHPPPRWTSKRVTHVCSPRDPPQTIFEKSRLIARLRHWPDLHAKFCTRSPGRFGCAVMSEWTSQWSVRFYIYRLAG
jgi:hypothetical protein